LHIYIIRAKVVEILNAENKFPTGKEKLIYNTTNEKGGEKESRSLGR